MGCDHGCAWEKGYVRTQGTELPIRKPQESMPTAVFTQVVPIWVCVWNVSYLLLDDTAVMGTVQREQWGGPVIVGQEANLRWGGHRAWGG